MNDERIPLITFKNPDTGELHVYYDGDARPYPETWKRADVHFWHNQVHRLDPLEAEFMRRMLRYPHTSD